MTQAERTMPIYCVACAMPQYQVIVTGCTACGHTKFTSTLRLLNWQLAITHNDRQWLKSVRISPE